MKRKYRLDNARFKLNEQLGQYELTARFSFNEESIFKEKKICMKTFWEGVMLMSDDLDKLYTDFNEAREAKFPSAVENFVSYQLLKWARELQIELPPFEVYQCIDSYTISWLKYE